jgi:hypothetical protein
LSGDGAALAAVVGVEHTTASVGSQVLASHLYHQLTKYRASKIENENNKACSFCSIVVRAGQSSAKSIMAE